MCIRRLEESHKTLSKYTHGLCHKACQLCGADYFASPPLPAARPFGRLHPWPKPNNGKYKATPVTRYKIAGIRYMGMRRVNPGNGHACILTFGKRHKDLTPDEHRQWRRMQHLADYYGKHDENRKWARKVPFYRKQVLLKALGWSAQCSRCGYDKCLAALDFHHKVGTVKIGPVMELSSLAKRKEEALKCDLVCANCHRELHADQIVPQRTRVGGPRKPLDPLTASFFRHLGIVRPGEPESGG